MGRKDLVNRLRQNHIRFPLPKCRMSRHSLERAYIFLRVRLGVARLLLLFGHAPPASQDRAKIVLRCRAVMIQRASHQRILHTLEMNAADFDKLSDAEKEHFYWCSKCRQFVDKREL